MKKILVTPWMNGKPARPGVYMRKTYLGGGFSYSHWTGKTWLSACESVEKALNAISESMFQSLPWRGLRDQPQHAERRPGLCVCIYAARLQRPDANTEDILYRAKNLYTSSTLAKTVRGRMELVANPFYMAGQRRPF